MELHKRRKTLTDAEARYLLKQIMFAVQYLHDVKVSLVTGHTRVHTGTGTSYTLVVCYTGDPSGSQAWQSVPQ